MANKYLAQFRVRFVNDETAQFEECNGEARPLTEEEYKGNEYQKNGQNISYADYRAYYGNPERHIYLGCIVERQCKCCGSWKNLDGGSLWNIDFMDDSPEWRAVDLDHNYTVPEALALPGYLSEVARDVLDEAGYKFPPSAYCARKVRGKRCTYFHVAGSKFCAQHGGKR